MVLGVVSDVVYTPMKYDVRDRETERGVGRIELLMLRQILNLLFVEKMWFYSGLKSAELFIPSSVEHTTVPYIELW